MKDVILDLALQAGIRLREITSINELGLDFQTAVGEGLDGTKWILRIPRRKDLFPQIQKEQSSLKFLKTRVSFDVPDWKVVTPQLIAYPLLTDKPALEVNPLSQEFTWNIDLNSLQYIESLGRILIELHSLTNEAKKLGIEARTPEGIRRDFFDDIQLVKTELGFSESLERQWRSWIDDDTYWPSFSSLIHGDLYAGHTLVNTTGQVSGIIDWSEMQIGDSSTDFAGQYVALGETQLDQLIAIYQAAGGKTWPRMKEHIIQRASAASLKFAVFALNTKNGDLITAAKEQLKSAQ
jgi:macrolide phosphotransferase